MSNVNVKIISELKNFVATVGRTRQIQEKFCFCKTDFTRQRLLPFERLVFFIVKLCKKTLSIELEKFFEEIGWTISCSVSAFTQQRIKLEPVFFFYWNMVLWRSYYLYAGKGVRRWKGYRVMAGDGSTISLVNTPLLSSYFGGQRNQQTDFVLAKTFYHYDILNELIVIAQIKPYRYGELNMAYDAVYKLEEDMVTLYDRNFSNYKMIALHLWEEKERKFVIRAMENQRIIKAFINSGQPSAIAMMKPTKKAIEGMNKRGFHVTKKDLLQIRLVRVELPNRVEVLITNLWEEEGHCADEFKDLYFLRWGIETNISIQKNILQLESFSGLTPQSVEQDFYATVLMTNLHSVLIKDAQQTIDNTLKHRKYPMKINKNKSFGRLKVSLISLFINNDVEPILKSLHDHFIKEVVPVIRGRTFKRVRKNVKAKSKFKTFTNFKPAY